MLQLFMDGGPFMYPILLCSVFAVSMFIDRLISLISAGARQRRFAEQVKQIGSPNRLEQLAELAETIDSPASELIQCAIANGNKSQAERELVIERVGSNIVKTVEKGIGTLEIIAHISPLLGLLGTVAGMIQAFMVIAKVGGQVDPSMLAGGISQALLTTGFGLTVAIPTLVCAYYLQGKADNIVSQMKDTATEFPELFAALQELQPDVS